MIRRRADQPRNVGQDCRYDGLLFLNLVSFGEPETLARQICALSSAKNILIAEESMHEILVLEEGLGVSEQSLYLAVGMAYFLDAQEEELLGDADTFGRFNAQG